MRLMVFIMVFITQPKIARNLNKPKIRELQLEEKVVNRNRLIND